MSKPITKPGLVHGMSDEDVLVPVGKHHHALVDRADLALVNDRAWQLLRGHRDKLYDSETDAARAYDRAAFDAWGEFAVLNLLAAGDVA